MWLSSSRVAIPTSSKLRPQSNASGCYRILGGLPQTGDATVRETGGGNGRYVGSATEDGVPPPHLTPRQAQILELASAGLSDKEIARRLRVTHRTVRTHFEKLFQESGIRNRAQAIAIWSGRPRQAQRARPADE
ncbi:MAG: helix-turn-helix transcriptional regulator, partial [Chloroflexi bacterium]